MIRRAHTATQRTALDAAIARRAGAAVAAYTQSHGHSAPTAHAWIETLHAGHKFVQNATRATPHRKSQAQPHLPRGC